MAADCKSAAPWSYGGSNPPLCTIKLGWAVGREGRRWIGQGERICSSRSRTDVGRVGPAGGFLASGGKNDGPGQVAHGGFIVAGFFRGAYPADGVRFAIACF